MTPPDQSLDLLVIATHPDDAELSVGGTIVKSVREGLKVGVLDLTDGEPTPHGSPEIRARETAAATAALGIGWRGNLGLPNRRVIDDLEARRSLAGAIRLIRPQIILAPYWDDAHPDHVAASRLADAARFWAKLSRTDLPGEPFHPPRIDYYWSIHLRIHPKPSYVVDISDAIEQKLDAVRCYESQVVTGRSQDFPTLIDDVRDRARYWGWTIHRAYGEPFACREEVGVESVRSIL
ncbi:MAG: bacillithiol biosynthesis deacetylase BshB1 [Planctomycetota bacterium]|nr:MAG: bacillithiol biosynthesis deacetylase BshB1 [Planctomycetota bacterium]REJ91657.1 MAG: bacillithiol biosynthesis deacetylase BshB1 [Planctomycetota bacterium]REK19974.1 MAG: bacillithiol biosynthesis deacetylase BshB1 [Planctomycetota bacterium]REK27541.1 MAG: bacillithiol biosynthesis deacetylase BshB1 [Planctomycetota bacterium]